MNLEERDKLLADLDELWKMHQAFGEVLDEIIKESQHE